MSCQRPYGDPVEGVGLPEVQCVVAGHTNREARCAGCNDDRRPLVVGGELRGDHHSRSGCELCRERDGDVAGGGVGRADRPAGLDGRRQVAKLGSQHIQLGFIHRIRTHRTRRQIHQLVRTRIKSGSHRLRTIPMNHTVIQKGGNISEVLVNVVRHSGRGDNKIV